MRMAKISVKLVAVWSNDEDKGFKLQYSKDGFGFGELIFRQYPKGNVVIETETMGVDFVKEILGAWVDKARLDL
jgi:hypothetical protein